MGGARQFRLAAQLAGPLLAALVKTARGFQKGRKLECGATKLSSHLCRRVST